MSFLDSPLVERLGWTLAHSLWQGTILGAVLIVVLAGLRNHSANLRYLVGCVALVAMVLLTAATFAVLENPSTDRKEPVTIQAESSAEPEGQMALVEAWSVEPRIGSPVPTFTVSEIARDNPSTYAETRSISLRLSRLLENVLPWAVAGWLVGVLLLSLRLFIGWQQVQQIRKLQTRPVERVWRDRFSRLALGMGVSKPIALFESALAESPLVIGWLKPVILFPATALTGLSQQQVEGLLAHELAHIRRHDYLVNLLQSVIETVLFYHPVVWWISKQIRVERENACDDLV